MKIEKLPMLARWPRMMAIVYVVCCTPPAWGGEVIDGGDDWENKFQLGYIDATAEVFPETMAQAEFQGSGAAPMSIAEGPPLGSSEPAPAPSAAMNVEPPKKYPTVKVGGAFQVDSAWFSQNAASRASVGDIQDGSSFRRARLNASGSVSEEIDYRFEMDFAFFGRPTFTDVWAELKEVPVLGNIRVGQWKQPFSLEVVSSYRFTTFAERSLLFPAFVPFRHIGAGFYDHSEDERMTWAASVYRSGQDQYGGTVADSGGYSGVGRLTFLPWYDEESGGRYYLHLGTAYNFSAPNNRIARFRSFPELYVGQERPGAVGTSGVPQPGAFDGVPFFVDTGPIAVWNYHVLGTELLWVHGPFSLQSEAMYLFATRQDRPDLGFPGLYAQVGYFLTGEHRPFSRPLAVIDQVVPRRTIGQGLGAWEVAARWSWVHLNDQDVRGGRLQDWTFGLNWYLHARGKVQFNYIVACLNDAQDRYSTTGLFGLRGQLDF
jgi:phosphate-selective porin OprO/OprP